MGTLTYLMITSTDGFTAGPDGRFDWSTPTPAIHAHVERLTAGLAGQIYGPRMWETMQVWRDIRPGDGQDYGDALRDLKAASGGEMTIGGPGLAAAALREGEVDHVARYVVPVAVGGGTPWWPLGLAARLELATSERLDAGWVHLRYRVLRCRHFDTVRSSAKGAVRRPRWAS